MIRAFLFAFFLAGPAWAGDYALAPEEVAEGVYVLWGRQEPMTAENGANICNTAFIVGDNACLGPATRDDGFAADGVVTLD